MHNFTHRACHDANIAPWLLLANRLGLEASREDPKPTNHNYPLIVTLPFA